MTTNVIASRINDLVQATVECPVFTTHNAAGNPIKVKTAILNGHKVQVRATGWTAESVVVWVDGSDENLTVEQATAIVIGW